jgi:hypothetical protein
MRLQAIIEASLARAAEHVRLPYHLDNELDRAALASILAADVEAAVQLALVRALRSMGEREAV